MVYAESEGEEQETSRKLTWRQNPPKLTHFAGTCTLNGKAQLLYRPKVPRPRSLGRKAREGVCNTGAVGGRTMVAAAEGKALRRISQQKYVAKVIWRCKDRRHAVQV